MIHFHLYFSKNINLNFWDLIFVYKYVKKIKDDYTYNFYRKYQKAQFDQRTTSRAKNKI
jgi:hypothetical protein